MKPDSKKHNPDPAYLRGLLKSTGMSTVEVAATLEVSSRAIRAYLSSEDSASYRVAPYLFQYALEQLANKDH